MADLSSLVIRLSADVASLQSDLGRANHLARSSANEMAASFDTAGAAVRQFLKGLAGAFSVGELINFGKHAIDVADQFNKMAQKVGVSVESLSALNVQAKLSDVSIDGLQTGLAKLSKNFVDAAAGGKENAATFKAMGISLKDANGNLKSTQTILEEVSKKFAGYADSAEKTALAQRAFGKSGAELIPLLNQLGAEGFAKAREEAEKYNQVISGETAAQAEKFNDNLTRLQMAASGFANAVAANLLPSLVDLTNKMADGATTSDGYATAAKGVSDLILILIQNFVDLGRVLGDIPSDFKKSSDQLDNWAASLGVTNVQMQKFIDLMPKIKPVQTGNGLIGVEITPDSPIDKFLNWVNNPTAGSALADKMQIATLKPQIDEFVSSVKTIPPNVDTASSALVGLAPHVEAVGNAAAKANAPIVANAAAMAAAESAARKLASAQVEAAKFLSTLAGIGADKYTKALEQYNSQLAQADVIYKKLKVSGESAANATKFLADAQQQAKEGFESLQQAIRNENDATAILSHSFSAAESELNNQIRLLGLDEQARKADELATRLITAALGDLKDFMGPLTEEQQRFIDKMTAMSKTTTATTTAIELQKQSVKEFTNIWVQAGNSIADALGNAVVQGGDFMKSLVDIAKQVVQQIISYFAKLAIINPILNSIFGGSAGWTQLATMGGGGSGGIMSLAASAFGGGGTGGGTGGFGNLSGVQSIFGAGSSQTITGSLFGSGEWDSGIGATAAPYISAAAGVYAGYNRYQQAGGGAGGIAGGLAYGAGTYAAGAGIASVAAGGGFAAGVSGAFAIPVVGWIALAAMLIDKFSGGKLFGTKGEVKSGVSTLSIDSAGANYSTFLALKGQGALFSGAQWSTKTVAQTEEEKKAAQAFFESMTKTMAQYAEQFGVKAGDLVSAQFGQQFDKNGKPTGVTSATIAGQTYSNITPEQFSAGYVAANQLQVLSQFDDKLLDTVKAYRENIDEMVSIANGLSQAQAMFQAGGSFLAIAGDQTLSAVVELASGLQQAGESIGDTITRLIQAQAAYDSFVQQFKPAVKYVDDFEAALSGINAQMKANIAQANALAKAAGAAGASEKDLANIHNYAAQQAAAALKALEASAQSLAFGLGLTTVGSLDEVNQEIAALQAKAGQGSGAIKGFGNAISDAASRATDAMNLLLGNLSPLNDQQKLQTALGGLRSGTATVDQVLEIGRRLYASSQAYTDLFNSVKGYAGRGTWSPTGGAGGGTGATGGGLSGAERERLADLLAEQQQLQAAATMTQYQTLAQQIAEIASAKGEDWRTVLEQMGISVDKFEAGLQLTDAGTNDLITSIQAQLDDNGENTTILADLLKQILVALGGTPTDDSTTPQAPYAHSGHALPGQIGDAVERSFNRSLDRGHSMHSRSARPQVPA